MFENLDQKDQDKEQNSSISGLNGAGAQPLAAPKVEDMFADVKDTSIPKNQISASSGQLAQKPAAGGAKRSSNKAMRILVAVIIVLVIIFLGLFLVSRYASGMGGLANGFNLAKTVESWKGLIFKKQPAAIIVENNENKTPSPSVQEIQQPVQPVPEQPANPGQPVESIAAPAVSSEAAAVSPAAATATPANIDYGQRDSDGDGLTDYDEIYVYKTDPAKIDTDGDSFADGAEVKSGYNPNGSGKLIK